jgi:hypothetical protein
MIAVVYYTVLLSGYDHDTKDYSESGRISVEFKAVPPLVNEIVPIDEQCSPRTHQENSFKEHFRNIQNRDDSQKANNLDYEIEILIRSVVLDSLSCDSRR